VTALLANWDRVAAALEYPEGAPAEMQERYVAVFDLDPACSLNIGWHLFGERHERGEFLAVLRAELRRTGIDDSGELPDYLPFVLRLIPRLDEIRARQLRIAVSSALEKIRAGVERHDDGFVAVIEAARALVEADRSAAL
jgi:nitrate reductase delta subunit